MPETKLKEESSTEQPWKCPSVKRRLCRQTDFHGTLHKVRHLLKLTPAKYRPTKAHGVMHEGSGL